MSKLHNYADAIASHKHTPLWLMGLAAVWAFGLSLGLSVSLQSANLRAQEIEAEPEEDVQEEFVDPKEIKDALKQFKDQRKEIRSFEQKLTRSKDIANKEQVRTELRAYVAALATFEQQIKNPPADLGQRGALQEYYDARTWDTLEEFRMRIQVPSELKDAKRSLGKIRKMLQGKAFLKLGLDIQRLTAILENLQGIVDRIDQAYQAGDWEAMRENMEEIWQNNMHPGRLEHALNRIRELKNMAQKVKDPRVVAAIEEMMAPVYEALYDSDFDEVHAILDEYEDDFRRLINLIVKSKWNLQKAEGKIGDLEALIREKFDVLRLEQEQRDAEREAQQAPQEQSAPAPASVETVPPASVSVQ